MTVELNMPEVKIIDKSNLIEMGKPQLRMVDLNLLTVFDAVMKNKTLPVPRILWGCRNLLSVMRSRA